MADREQTRRDARLSAFDTAEEATRLRPDREQTRRDALDKLRIVERGNRMQRIVFTNAEAEALRSELEQAERERDEALRGESAIKAHDWLLAEHRAAEARLAKVPALVDVLRGLADPLMARFTVADCQRIARSALASWESETESRALKREDTEATKGEGS